MKSEDHQDIIKQMAERLREHSVPYKEGAWERFKEVEKKKSRHMVLWPYFSAAAVILIAIILFLKPSQQIIMPSELVVRSNEKQMDKEVGIVNEPSAPGLQTSTIDKESVTKVDMQKRNREIVLASKTTNEYVSDNSIQVERLDVNLLKLEDMTAYNENKEVREGNSKVDDGFTRPSLITSVKEKKEPVDFLTALSAIKEEESFHENRSMEKKWSLGLDVAPNIGNNNHVNMGAGVSFAYSISPKVSISSGISYLQVGAEGMPNPSLNFPSASSRYAGSPTLELSSPGVAYPGGRSQTKILNKIEASVAGLDIPFAINYHVNKRLYASAGFSVFNVLNEGRISQFENRVVDVVYRGADNKTPEPVVQTFLSKELISEKDYQGRNVNGFFNFSVGYAIPVSKKVGLSIEPFFKMQMSTLAEEDMNLSNGGIKISTRF